MSGMVESSYSDGWDDALSEFETLIGLIIKLDEKSYSLFELNAFLMEKLKEKENKDGDMRDIRSMI